MRDIKIINPYVKQHRRGHYERIKEEEEENEEFHSYRGQCKPLYRIGQFETSVILTLKHEQPTAVGFEEKNVFQTSGLTVRKCRIENIITTELLLYLSFPGV